MRFGEEMGSDHKAGDRPNGPMQNDLTPARRSIGLAKSHPPMQPERERQSRWNQQTIVEISPKKPTFVRQWNEPTVYRVGKTRDETEGISSVRESPHRSAAMKRPVPKANSIFHVKFM